MATSLPGSVRGALDVMSAGVFENRTFSAGPAFDSVTNGIENAAANFDAAVDVLGR